MNWNVIEGKWKELAGAIRERWGDITDDEVSQLGGRLEHLEGLVQQKYGLSQQDAASQIDDWASKMKQMVRK